MVDVKEFYLNSFMQIYNNGLLQVAEWDTIGIKETIFAWLLAFNIDSLFDFFFFLVSLI